MECALVAQFDLWDRKFAHRPNVDLRNIVWRSNRQSKSARVASVSTPEKLMSSKETWRPRIVQCQQKLRAEPHKTVAWLGTRGVWLRDGHTRMQAMIGPLIAADDEQAQTLAGLGAELNRGPLALPGRKKAEFG
jgi:hypothetical protein